MDFASQIASTLASGNLISLPLSLAAGVVAGLNPCCIALYPAATATCCVGRNNSSRRSLSSTIYFIIGIAASMAVLGISVSLAGRITGVGVVGRHLVALVPILMGMHILGWLRLPLEQLTHSSLRTSGAFGTGFLLSLVIGPCATPVLASVLSYAANQGQILFGALLLFIFGLGVGMPILLVGTTAGNLIQRLDSIGWKVWIDRVAGAWLLALGLYLLWIA